MADLFAGSGAVSAALSSKREVTAVDIQEYARVLCSAILRPARISPERVSRLGNEALRAPRAVEEIECLQPLIDHELDCIEKASFGDTGPLVEFLEAPPLAALDKRGNFLSTKTAEAAHEAMERLRSASLWQSRATTVARNFGGIYFSYRQAAEIDSLLELAGSADKGDRDTLIAAVLSSASQLVNTIGKQFAQPIRPRNKHGSTKPGLARVVLRDRSQSVSEVYGQWLLRYSALPAGPGTSLALRADYLEAMADLGESFSVVYADPPYTRDHYSRFYHVLETMCLRDEPEISHVRTGGTNLPSRGAYRSDRHQSPFCIRSEAADAFNRLFKSARARDLPVVLSYSPHEVGDGTHPRVVSMATVLEIAHSHYRRVEMMPVTGVTHNQLNRSGLKLRTREQAEILLKCFR